MVVPGVAVADQYPGEIGQDAAVVDVGAAAAADVHQCEVLGAGHVHVGQRAGGPAGGLVGVQHRRGDQQVLQVRQERRHQLVRGAAAGPGGEPGRQMQAGQGFQQGGGPPDRQVVPAGQQGAHGQGSGPDPHRRPGRGHHIDVHVVGARPVRGADHSAAWAGLGQQLILGDHRRRYRWQVHHLPAFGHHGRRTGQRSAAPGATPRFNRHPAVRVVRQRPGHPGVTGLLPGLATRPIPRRPRLRGFLRPRRIRGRRTG